MNVNKKLPSCFTYLVDIMGKGKSYHQLCDIKTKSLINACGQNPDLENDSFLIVNPSIVPCGLKDLCPTINMTVVNPSVGFNSFGDLHVDVEYYDGELIDFVAQGRKFDWVIASDEWITYADSEEEQQQMISLISKITRKGFFTTLKDYKNMYANQRYFEEPFVLRSDKGDAIVVRQREWDNSDRQSWTSKNYIIHNEELYLCNPWRRRTMYFKQMAKFCSDVGSKNFSVEKSNMYKPPFSKTFEYVIFVDFQA